MLSFSRHQIPTPQFQLHPLLIHPAGKIFFAHAHGLEYVTGSAKGEFFVAGVIQLARVVLGVSSRSRSARSRVANRVQARPWNSTLFSRSASPTEGVIALFGHALCQRPQRADLAAEDAISICTRFTFAYVHLIEYSFYLVLTYLIFNKNTTCQNCPSKLPNYGSFKIRRESLCLRLRTARDDPARSHSRIFIKFSLPQMNRRGFGGGRRGSGRVYFLGSYF
jgi:hypothetical protein